MSLVIHIAVKGILFNSQGQILLLKRSNADAIDAAYWDLPGGRVQEGEEKEAALLREINEETGLIATVLSLHNQWEYCPDGSNSKIVGYTYLCKLVEEAEVVLSPEHSEYRWINPLDIDGYKAHKNLKAEIKRVVFI